jgi:hypothetical protein
VVVEVGERGVVIEEGQGLEAPHKPAGVDAGVLQDHGVLLLGHEAGTLGKALPHQKAPPARPEEEVGEEAGKARPQGP